MSVANSCPQCQSENTYPEQNLMVCADCFHEWDSSAVAQEPLSPAADRVLDAHGQELCSGDSVTLIKDLKVKGASSSLKAGTKVKNIRIIEPVDAHNLFCKVDGVGGIYLKSEFVKKA